MRPAFESKNEEKKKERGKKSFFQYRHIYIKTYSWVIRGQAFNQIDLLARKKKIYNKNTKYEARSIMKYEPLLFES